MLNTAWALIRDTVNAWLDDYAPSMGAALAFYTLFSIAPLLLIVISVAGLLFGEPTARGEILKQGTDTGIDLLGLVLFEILEERPVIVPTATVDGDEGHADLGEAAGEEEALAKGVAAIAVAEFFAFGGEVESGAGAAGDDEVEGALVILVEVVGSRGLLDVVAGAGVGRSDRGASEVPVAPALGIGFQQQVGVAQH